ncbi:hypothetical protein CUMW_270270 [Citrus unshiu]|uniref:Uncharacterized protein n=1 Tax=Citrus unshiu TaxID=55188 RepID=A0A2H5QX77_CITUN|nr:hypothetical protein CUMW_270270 [Citrus unshiu]
MGNNNVMGLGGGVLAAIIVIGIGCCRDCNKRIEYEILEAASGVRLRKRPRPSLSLLYPSSPGFQKG